MTAVFETKIEIIIFDDSNDKFIFAPKNDSYMIFSQNFISNSFPHRL